MASFRFSKDSSMLFPWLAMSRSGHHATYRSSSLQTMLEKFNFSAMMRHHSNYISMKDKMTSVHKAFRDASFLS